MATANPIIMPAGQKGLTRRTLLAGLPLAGASLALPFPMRAVSDFIDRDNDEPHPVLTLPFVREATATERAMGLPPRRFWSVQPTGVHSADCGTGARYAQLALDYMVREQTPYILQWAVFDMMRLGREYSGIEVGFMSTFGRIATETHAARLARDAGLGGLRGPAPGPRQLHPRRT